MMSATEGWGDSADKKTNSDMGVGGLANFWFFLTRRGGEVGHILTCLTKVWISMQNLQKAHCFSQKLMLLDPQFCLKGYFSFFFILYTCLTYYQILTFFLRGVFHLINWTAKKRFLIMGGGGVSRFQIFSDIGFFLLKTSPTCNKYAKLNSS